MPHEQQLLRTAANTWRLTYLSFTTRFARRRSHAHFDGTFVVQDYYKDSTCTSQLMYYEYTKLAKCIATSVNSSSVLSSYTSVQTFTDSYENSLICEERASNVTSGATNKETAVANRGECVPNSIGYKKIRGVKISIIDSNGESATSERRGWAEPFLTQRNFARHSLRGPLHARRSGVGVVRRAGQWQLPHRQRAAADHKALFHKRVPYPPIGLGLLHVHWLLPRALRTP